jgi:hypothetical protein
LDRIVEGRLEGRQVDWGSWVAKAKRAEILTFVEEVYVDDPASLDAVRSFVEGVNPNETYALVASEL